MQPDPARLPNGLRYLDGQGLADLFSFPADMAALQVPVNRLFNQVLVRFFYNRTGAPSSSHEPATIFARGRGCPWLVGCWPN